MTESGGQEDLDCWECGEDLEDMRELFPAHLLLHQTGGQSSLY